MNGGHSRAQTSRKCGIDLVAGWPRESQTAAVKRAQSHSVSSSFVAVVLLRGWDEGGLADSGSGVRESMERVSVRVYGGKWTCGMALWWSRCGCGVVVMRMVVRLGSWRLLVGVR